MSRKNSSAQGSVALIARTSASVTGRIDREDRTAKKYVPVHGKRPSPFSRLKPNASTGRGVENHRHRPRPEAHRLWHYRAQLLAEHRPAHAAVEQVFVNVNPSATLLLGQARGAAICALVAGGAQVYEYTALQLTQAVAGYGRARKEQIQHMAARLLQLDGLPGPDAADALGVAICHAHSGDALATLGNLAPAVAKKGFRTRRWRLVGPMSTRTY